MWLFDTVALSETIKPKPNPGFLAWLSGVPRRELHTSVICVGEIRRGAERLGESVKRRGLIRWLEIEIIDQLGDQILPIDLVVAQTWARMELRRTLPTADALIGATAKVHSLTVVTRNVRDFDGIGVPVLNPWI